MARILAKEGGISDLATLQVSIVSKNAGIIFWGFPPTTSYYFLLALIRALRTCIPIQIYTHTILLFFIFSQAAILHDTVEDTDTTIEEIEEHFGKEVRDIVADVTDDKTLHWKERKRLQIVHSPFICPKAKLVKLADKLYNLRDLEKSTPEGWTEERVQIYFEWSAKVINGIRGNNEVLEKELDKLFTKRDIVIEKE